MLQRHRPAHSYSFQSETTQPAAGVTLIVAHPVPRELVSVWPHKIACPPAYHPEHHQRIATPSVPSVLNLESSLDGTPPNSELKISRNTDRLHRRCSSRHNSMHSNQTVRVPVKVGQQCLEGRSKWRSQAPRNLSSLPRNEANFNILYSRTLSFRTPS